MASRQLFHYEVVTADKCHCSNQVPVRDVICTARRVMPRLAPKLVIMATLRTYSLLAAILAPVDRRTTMMYSFLLQY